MARGSATGRRTATVYRLPTDGDHPVLWTMGLAFAVGLLAFVYSVRGEGRRRRGLGLPVPTALVIGVAVALVVAVVYGIVLRRAPRGLALRVGPEGVAFTQARTERWSIPWTSVISVGIVHSALPRYRGEPSPSYLRLELEDGTAPDEPTLHHHEGAWWFALTGFDTAARLHHDLRRRVPDRLRSVETEARLPHHLARPARPHPRR